MYVTFTDNFLSFLDIQPHIQSNIHPDIQPNVSFYSKKIAIGSNSLKKPIKEPSQATLDKTFEQNPQFHVNNKMPCSF